MFKAIMKSAIILLCLTATSHAAGFAYSNNFHVFTETQQQAVTLLNNAERYRESLSLKWLGRKLPSGKGKSTINFVSGSKNKSNIWRLDDSRRTMHVIYLKGQFQTIDTELKQQILRSIFATQFPLVRVDNKNYYQFPRWIECGISAQYNMNVREERKHTIDWMLKTGNWPLTSRLFDCKELSSDDATLYFCAAESVDYLIELSKGDEIKLIKFGVDCYKLGLDNALQKHYNIESKDDFFNSMVHHLSSKYS